MKLKSLFTLALILATIGLSLPAVAGDRDDRHNRRNDRHERRNDRHNSRRDHSSYYHYYKLDNGDYIYIGKNGDYWDSSNNYHKYSENRSYKKYYDSSYDYEKYGKYYSGRKYYAKYED
jgi:hypothetical protein